MLREWSTLGGIVRVAWRTGDPDGEQFIDAHTLTVTLGRYQLWLSRARSWR